LCDSEISRYRRTKSQTLAGKPTWGADETSFFLSFLPDVTTSHEIFVTDQPDFQRGQDFPGTSGLLPAIAQDFESGRVLMMAWMDESAWRETIETQRAVYFSRSRGKLWRKGETSGHQQIVKEARIDCDADTILLLVEQTGAACHEGYQSCFFRTIDSNYQTHIADERLVDPNSVYGRPD